MYRLKAPFQTGATKFGPVVDGICEVATQEQVVELTNAFYGFQLVKALAVVPPEYERGASEMEKIVDMPEQTIETLNEGSIPQTEGVIVTKLPEVVPAAEPEIAPLPMRRRKR